MVQVPVNLFLLPILAEEAAEDTQSAHPTQFLFYEFHHEWEEIKTGLLHRSCKDLRAGYAECLATLEAKLADIQNGETVNAVSDLVANQCATIAEPALKKELNIIKPVSILNTIILRRRHLTSIQQV